MLRNEYYVAIQYWKMSVGPCFPLHRPFRYPTTSAVPSIQASSGESLSLDRAVLERANLPLTHQNTSQKYIEPLQGSQAKSPTMPSFHSVCHLVTLNKTHSPGPHMNTPILYRVPNQPLPVSPIQAHHCLDMKKDQNCYYGEYRSLHHEHSQWPLYSEVSKQLQRISDIALARLAFVVKYTARVHCRDYVPVVIPGVAASTPNRVLQISLCPKIIAIDNRVFDCD